MGPEAEALLDCLPLRPGCRFVDLGCGSGAYFFPAFERLRGKGVFVAVELKEERLPALLSRLEAYVEHPGFTRIEVARAKPGRLPLPDGSADVLLVSQAFHSLESREKYLGEARRVLARGATLGLMDWGGPSPEASQRQALAGLEEAGFRWPVIHSGFEPQWCLTVRK